MRRLRDLGNTLVVVEHEEAVIRAADHLVDIGPGRGEGGGELVYAGPGATTAAAAAAFFKAHPRSLTMEYLSGAKTVPVPSERREAAALARGETRRPAQSEEDRRRFPPRRALLRHRRVRLRQIDPRALGPPWKPPRGARTSHREAEIGQCREIRGAGHLREVVMVDQSPLARTPRSTPAVYTGLFETIRKLFAESSDGMARGLTPGYFSFNSGAGRCGRCMGNGFEKVEMQFLSDLYVTCPECEGKRYTPEALEIRLGEKNLDEVLSMTVSESIAWFSAMEGKAAASIVSGLNLLAEVGLGYLRLGQPLNTLSGGESQRLKLVGHLLAKPARKAADGKTSLLLFDEPTTGLHFDDTTMLLRMFDRLVAAGDSVIVIEHNLDVIAAADHVIDWDRRPGVGGGAVVVCGTPEEVVACPESRTGRYLRERLGQRSEVRGQKSAVT